MVWPLFVCEDFTGRASRHVAVDTDSRCSRSAATDWPAPPVWTAKDPAASSNWPASPHGRRHRADAALRRWHAVRALAQLVRHRRSRPKRAARVGQSRGAGNRRPKPPTWPLSFDPHLYTVESAHTASAERAYASPRAAGDPATGLPVFRVRQASWHHGIFGGGNSGIRDE